jgi:hypothetical protein
VEYVYEVQGKLPEYVPPVVLRSVIDTGEPESAIVRRVAQSTRRKRNIMKENIQKVRVSRPGTARVRTGRAPFR